MVVNNEKNLQFSLKGWNDAYGEISNKEDTLDFYKTSYEDEIPKGELKKALSSVESWAQYAYNKRLLFHVTAFLENEQPYADILFNDGNVIVHFLDECNRIYMAYEFLGGLKKDLLFLDSLRYYIYEDDKNFYGRRHSIRDYQYIFTPEGKLTIWDRYLEDGKWYEEAKEAELPVNVASNWEPYPKLGDYNGIVKMERWKDGELSLPFRGENPVTIITTYDGRSLSKTNTPYYRLGKDDKDKVEEALSTADLQHKANDMEAAVNTLQLALEKIPEPKENFKESGDITVKLIDYLSEVENFDGAFAALDQLETFLNAEDYNTIALYRAKVHYLNEEKDKAFNFFQSFTIRRSTEELRKGFPEYYAIFQSLL